MGEDVSFLFGETTVFTLSFVDFVGEGTVSPLSVVGFSLGLVHVTFLVGEEFIIIHPH